MGHLTRIHDWSGTSLGKPDTWPQSLKTILGVLLNSRFPKFLFWGEELLCFYNDAYRPSLGNGGKHPNALGKPAAAVWPEIWESLVEPLTNHIRAGAEATLSEDQLVPIYRNGRMEDVYWTFCYSPVFDELSHINGVLVTCTETTEKVNNLKKLAESRNKLHLAIEAAQLGTWDYDVATAKFDSNNRLRDWFGLSRKSLADYQDIYNVVVPDDKQRVAAVFQEAMRFASGGWYDVEYTIEHPVTKMRRTVRVLGKVEFDENQCAYRVISTVQDITQQVLARKKLEAERMRFMTFMETMPNMAWTTTPQGEPTFVNQQWYDYTGQEANKLSDTMWKRATHPDDVPGTVKIESQALKTGEPYTVEYRLERADGAYRWHLARAAAMRNETGEIVYWLGTITDIHEQKELEARLDEQVIERTRQLEESVQDLQRSNENLQQFAYVASHDLQEPLRKIQSFGDILKNRFGDQLGDGQDYLNRMQSAAGRMSVLIEDLLTFSRISTLRDTTVSVDLNQVLQSVLLDLELVIRESGAVVEIPDSLPIVEGDASQLRQLFQNLLSNSLKFQSPSTTPDITISSQLIAQTDLPVTVRPARYATSYHCISVIDNGIGFEEQYLDRIFEVFQRLHGKSQYSGTGIGLAICQKVATSHGGAIMGNSQLSEGATFSVYLPICEVT